MKSSVLSYGGSCRYEEKQLVDLPMGRNTGIGDELSGGGYVNFNPFHDCVLFTPLPKPHAQCAVRNDGLSLAQSAAEVVFCDFHPNIVRMRPLDCDFTLAVRENRQLCCTGNAIACF